MSRSFPTASRTRRTHTAASRTYRLGHTVPQIPHVAVGFRGVVSSRIRVTRRADLADQVAADIVAVGCAVGMSAARLGGLRLQLIIVAVGVVDGLTQHVVGWCGHR